MKRFILYHSNTDCLQRRGAACQGDCRHYGGCGPFIRACGLKINQRQAGSTDPEELLWHYRHQFRADPIGSQRPDTAHGIGLYTEYIDAGHQLKQHEDGNKRFIY